MSPTVSSGVAVRCKNSGSLTTCLRTDGQGALKLWGATTIHHSLSSARTCGKAVHAEPAPETPRCRPNLKNKSLSICTNPVTVSDSGAHQSFCGVPCGALVTFSIHRGPAIKDATRRRRGYARPDSECNRRTHKGHTSRRAQGRTPHCISRIRRAPVASSFHMEGPKPWGEAGASSSGAFADIWPPEPSE